MHLILSLDKLLHVNDKTYNVQIGSGGFIEESKKQEGDKATPCGVYPIMAIYYRDDRVQVINTKVPTYKINKDDGWCDDPEDESYNKFVKLPYAARCENLWREDRVYDIIIVIGHNTNPTIPGKGSAIFIHVARGKCSPTDGCIALSKSDLLYIAEHVDENSCIEIGVMTTEGA